MNKSDIVSRVADRIGLSKSTAKGAVDTVLRAISEALAREETERTAGFGTFAASRRSARTGRNPQTAESVPIAALKAPSFKSGTEETRRLSGFGPFIFAIGGQLSSAGQAVYHD